MKVTLMNAISLDGFIAKPDGDSDWVTDDEQFDAAIAEFGCLLIGRKTFEQYEGELYPVDGAVTFVYTSDSKSFEDTENLKFLQGTPDEVLEQISRAGFSKVLLAGGGAINASFAAAELIQEIIVDVHPLTLGQGIRLLGDFTGSLDLELIAEKQYKGFVQLRYKVIPASG